MHVSKEPQDDGYTLIPRPEKAEMNESDLSLTFESSSDTPKRKKTPREVRNKEQQDCYFMHTVLYEFMLSTVYSYSKYNYKIN